MRNLAKAGRCLWLSIAMAGLVANSTAAEFSSVALTRDRPQEIGAVTALCTGVGADMQSASGLQDYTMRIQFAGGGGQYLANARVKLTTLAGQPLIAVQCPGAWLLFKMSPGKYHLTAIVQGHRRSATVFALQSGAQVVLRFPEITGNE